MDLAPTAQAKRRNPFLMAQQITRVRPVTQSHFFRNTGIGLATLGAVAGSMTSANAFATATPSTTPSTPQVTPSLALATSPSVSHDFVSAQASGQAAPAVQQQAPEQAAPAPSVQAQPADNTVQEPWAQQSVAQAAPAPAEAPAAPGADNAAIQPAADITPAEDAAPAVDAGAAPWDSGAAQQDPAVQGQAEAAAPAADGTQVGADGTIQTIPAAETDPQTADGQAIDPTQAAPADQAQSAEAYNGQATEVEPAAQTDAVTGSRAQVVQDAMAGVGGAYVWGGSDYMAWDCSGFVSYVYAQSGVNLDSYTYSMVNQLTPTANPQAGDVVFTNNYAHVGIYLGDGQMVSALNPEQGTQVTAVDGGGMMTVDGYYTSPALG